MESCHFFGAFKVPCFVGQPLVRPGFCPLPGGLCDQSVPIGPLRRLRGSEHLKNAGGASATQRGRGYSTPVEKWSLHINTMIIICKILQYIYIYILYTIYIYTCPVMIVSQYFRFYIGSMIIQKSATLKQDMLISNGHQGRIHGSVPCFFCCHMQKPVATIVPNSQATLNQMVQWIGPQDFLQPSFGFWISLVFFPDRWSMMSAICPAMCWTTSAGCPTVRSSLRWKLRVQLSWRPEIAWGSIAKIIPRSWKMSKTCWHRLQTQFLWFLNSFFFWSININNTFSSPLFSPQKMSG